MITEGIDFRFWTMLRSLWFWANGPLFRNPEKPFNIDVVVMVFDERFSFPNLLFVTLDDK